MDRISMDIFASSILRSDLFEQGVYIIEHIDKIKDIDCTGLATILLLSSIGTNLPFLQSL
jgi:hypothetical protein